MASILQSPTILSFGMHDMKVIEQDRQWVPKLQLQRFRCCAWSKFMLRSPVNVSLNNTGEFGHYRCWKMHTGEYLEIFGSTDKIRHENILVTFSRKYQKYWTYCIHTMTLTSQCPITQTQACCWGHASMVVAPCIVYRKTTTSAWCTNFIHLFQHESKLKYFEYFKYQ